MRRFIYTPEMEQWLRDNAPGTPLRELYLLFNKQFNLNKTLVQIRSAIKARSIRLGTPKGYPKYSTRICTVDQARWLKEAYPSHSRKELTTAFNVMHGTRLGENQIIAFCKNHKLRSGRNGHFHKGHKSWNKGTIGLTSANKTSFKKRSVPANTLPLYSEVVNSYGYTVVKVPETNPYTGAKTRFREKHVLVWEKENGPVPKGQCIKFVDGDRGNFEPDNLVAIDRGVLVRINKTGYDHAPDALKPAILATAKLKHTICRLSK